MMMWKSIIPMRVNKFILWQPLLTPSRLADAKFGSVIIVSSVSDLSLQTSFNYAKASPLVKRRNAAISSFYENSWY
jgi:hypothetical protein